MIRKPKAITISGTVDSRGRLRLDRPVPVDPGPVEVTVRPTAPAVARRIRKRCLLDLAGSASEMLRDVDVDRKLNELRNEWHETGN